VFIAVANCCACLERVYPRDTTDTASEDPKPKTIIPLEGVYVKRLNGWTASSIAANSQYGVTGTDALIVG
jgi:hypothetical protein